MATKDVGTFTGKVGVGVGDTLGLAFLGTGSSPGFPAIRVYALTGSSAANVEVSSSTYGLFHFVNDTTGTSALVLHGFASATPTIIAQQGTEFVTGAPAAGETRLVVSGGKLNIRSGSSRNGNTYYAAMVAGATA